MKSIANRAKSFGWDNILNIIDSHRNTRSLLYDYGQLTKEEVKTHARNQWTNQHTRDAQNTEMLYHFLFESLDENFKATVLLKNHNYHVTMGTYTTEDGLCLLKQIIISTFVDTRATVSQIWKPLVEMTQQLETHKGNITKFNKWVEEQVAILQSRGEEAHDLLTYLWTTYKKAPDAKFVEYIQNLHNDFITGKSDFTAQELMNLADTMYKARVQMNEWALLSTEQEEIVALNTKIPQLEQANKSKCKTKEENKSKERRKTANVPFCPACQYRKMHGKPLRTKENHSKPSRVATEPGQIVSVDQLESPTPGFIAQLKGTLTKQRYKYATPLLFLWISTHDYHMFTYNGRSQAMKQYKLRSLSKDTHKKEECIYATTMQTMEDLQTKVSLTIAK